MNTREMLRPVRLLPVIFLALAAGGVRAEPVTYTLRTVADGALGSFSFYEAQVTIRLHGDTANVATETNADGGLVYVNRIGQASVTVTLGNKTVAAHFAPDQVYVRYDTESGVVGFGSPASPSYPVALGCANTFNLGGYTQDCAQSPFTLTGDAAIYATASLDNGLADSLSDPSSRSQLSAGARALPISLSRTTLLTGIAHSCPAPYTTFPYQSTMIAIASCPAKATLETDHGLFYLQDSYGFGQSAYVDGDINNFSLDHYANVGALQVEVMRRSDFSYTLRR